MAERRRREEAIRREEEERERLDQEERRRQYEREREDERLREAESEKRREEERLQYDLAKYPSSEDMFAEPRSAGGSSKFGVDLNLKKAAAPRVNVFSAESDEGESQTKKRALVPIQYTVEEMMAGGMSKEEIEKRQLEEKKKQVQEIINQIPTDPKQLFVYPVPWSLVDAVCFFYLDLSVLALSNRWTSFCVVVDIA